VRLTGSDSAYKHLCGEADRLAELKSRRRVARKNVVAYHSRRSVKGGVFKMQKIGFAEALDSIVASDPRYQRDAYVFLRDALDYTTKQQKKTKGASVRHVAGPELLQGVREYALKEFGPMVVTVLSYWGIRSTEDIGHMVFNLIGAGIFGKTEEDSIEDFKNVFDFHEAFVKPFEPEKRSHPDVPLGLPASAPKLS
jgi:uncharacterized repeat protein (TIGR04138 family)